MVEPTNRENILTLADAANGGGASDPLRVLQITDCHLGEQSGEKLAGMDTDESLDYVLDLIRAEQYDAGVCRANLLLATGDLSNNGSVGAYQRLEKKLGELNVANAWLPGNHDLRDLMVATVGSQRMPRTIKMGNWAVCLLDSAVPGQVGGELGAAELQALQSQLRALPADCHIMLCLHHQPVPVGSHWLDQQQVADSDALFALLVQERRLRAVVWGHVHQEFSARDPRLPHVELIATPSTCIQFAPNSDDFKLDTQLPGYRWLDLYSDGKITTGVSRLSGVDLAVDLASSGY